MNNFFDKQTKVLRLDELVSENPSFKKIMEDKVVTDEELKEQSQKVIDLIKKLEKELSENELNLVSETITELAVLYSVNQYKQIQELYQ